MTKEEVSLRFGIPENILDEYHNMELCDAVCIAMDDWKYTDEDLERLSMIIALHDMNFTKDEVETYMRLLIAGEATEKTRIKILDKQRKKALNDTVFVGFPCRLLLSFKNMTLRVKSSSHSVHTAADDSDRA